MSAITRIFAADHPAAAGHFPGNPIIPGAALLAEVLLAIEAALGQEVLPGQVRAAKFFHPVRPGDAVSIDVSHAVPGVLRFECKVGATLVLSGSVEGSA